METSKRISRQIKKRKQMSRIDTLRNRYDRINRLRNIAINERNILKAKQAQWLLFLITANLNLISQPQQWN
jgi:hypothetical protein